MGRYDKTIEKLKEMYPKYTKLIDEKSKDLDWQLIGWKNKNGDTICSTPMGELHYLESSRPYQGSLLHCNPVYMNSTQFFYSLELEIDEKEASCQEKQMDYVSEHVLKGVKEIYGHIPLAIDLPEKLTATSLWDEILEHYSENTHKGTPDYKKRGALGCIKGNRIPIVVVKAARQYRLSKQSARLLTQIMHITNSVGIPVIVFGTGGFEKTAQNDEQFLSRFEQIKFVSKPDEKEE